MPGFRKGKVPPPNHRSAVRPRRGARRGRQRRACPTAYDTALARTRSCPRPPQVDVTEIEDRETLTFAAEVDIRPEFDLPTTALAVDRRPTPRRPTRTSTTVDALLAGLRAYTTSSAPPRRRRPADRIAGDRQGSRDRGPGPRRACPRGRRRRDGPRLRRGGPAAAAKARAHLDFTPENSDFTSTPIHHHHRHGRPRTRPPSGRRLRAPGQ